MLEFVVFCCAFSVLFLEWWLCLAVVLLLEASILHVCLWCCWYLAVEVIRVFDYGVMWLHASVLLNWVLLSEWSGRRGEVHDFVGLGCSQRLPLSVWVVPATLRVPVAGLPQKWELGALSSGQGRLMPFVDPGRIEHSDRVQAASFAPWNIHHHHHQRKHKRRKHRCLQRRWPSSVDFGSRKRIRTNEKTTN